MQACASKRVHRSQPWRRKSLINSWFLIRLLWRKKQKTKQETSSRRFRAATFDGFAGENNGVGGTGREIERTCFGSANNRVLSSSCLDVDENPSWSIMMRAHNDLSTIFFGWESQSNGNIQFCLFCETTKSRLCSLAYARENCAAALRMRHGLMTRCFNETKEFKEHKWK